MRFPKRFVSSGALADAHLTVGDFRVMIALFSLAGEDNVASTTQNELADLAGISRKSTRAAIQRLSSISLLRHESRRGRATDYTVFPGYQLAPSEVPTYPQVADEQMAPSRAIRVPTYPQANGTPEGANSDAEMAPPEVPTPKTKPRAQLSEADEIFERSWTKWPKKAEKKASRIAFMNATKLRPARDLGADIERFGDAYERSVTEIRFVPALAAWLRGERWTDALPIPPVTTNAEKAALNYHQKYPHTTSRDDENLAVIARLDAQETLAAQDCRAGIHDLLPDQTCKHCDVRPWQLQLPEGSNF